jgi:hypothetical protein
MSLGMLTLFGPTTPSGSPGTWTPSSGAPTLTGQNGSLCAVLDWAMAQKSWTTLFSTTNSRVYKQAAGNGNCLLVTHDSAVVTAANFCLWRGAETATAATSAGLGNPFPTVALAADTAQRLQLSQTASATAVAYQIQISDRYIRLLTQSSTTASGWQGTHFGDPPATYSGDNYATVCTGIGGVANQIDIFTSISNVNLMDGWFDRTIDGTLLSSYAQAGGRFGQSVWGLFPNNPVAMGGYLNRILRDKISMQCFGSKTTTSGVLAIPNRVWIPNLWSPLHNGIGTSLLTGQTFTDTAYNASSIFRVYIGANSSWLIVEESDTWSIPSG